MMSPVQNACEYIFIFSFSLLKVTKLVVNWEAFNNHANQWGETIKKGECPPFDGLWLIQKHNHHAFNPHLLRCSLSVVAWCKRRSQHGVWRVQVSGESSPWKTARPTWSCEVSNQWVKWLSDTRWLDGGGGFTGHSLCRALKLLFGTGALKTKPLRKSQWQWEHVKKKKKKRLWIENEWHLVTGLLNSPLSKMFSEQHNGGLYVNPIAKSCELIQVRAAKLGKTALYLTP